jgi:hypothetical protein
MTVIEEIYRVCKHGAQVCIIAPYHQQSLNLANPYHKQVFNEHTPRFWTNAQTTAVPSEEFAHPHALSWGLSESDSSTPGIDFRCLKMEFFYFPEYQNLSLTEQRAARNKYLNVCDQMMFHLLVVKSSISEAEVEQLAGQMEYYEPPFVTIRKLLEQAEKKEQIIRELRETLAAVQQELQQATGVRETEVGKALATLAVREKELNQAQSSLMSTQVELAQMQAAFNATQQELQHAIATLERQLGQLQVGAAAMQQQLTRFERVKHSVTTELTAFRRRRATRWLRRFQPGGDLQNEIAPAFQQLKDDSLLFTRSLKGYRLQPSADLRFVPFLAYPLELCQLNLRGIMLAPIFDFPGTLGRFGIEIVSPANTIVAQCTVPVDQVDGRVPTRFEFAPIADSHQGRFWLRVFVRDVVEPVRVFEWRKYGWGGLGRLQTRAFCGFLFA